MSKFHLYVTKAVFKEIVNGCQPGTAFLIVNDIYGKFEIDAATEFYITDTVGGEFDLFLRLKFYRAQEDVVNNYAWAYSNDMLTGYDYIEYIAREDSYFILN